MNIQNKKGKQHIKRSEREPVKLLDIEFELTQFVRAN